VGLVHLPAQQQALLDQLGRPPRIVVPPRHDPEVPQRVRPEVDLTVQFGDHENLLVAGGRPRHVAEQPAGKREPEPGRELPTDLALSAERVEDLLETRLRAGEVTTARIPRIRRRAWPGRARGRQLRGELTPLLHQGRYGSRSPWNPASALST
jgi:hypothetical protein